MPGLSHASERDQKKRQAHALQIQTKQYWDRHNHREHGESQTENIAVFPVIMSVRIFLGLNLQYRGMQDAVLIKIVLTYIHRVITVSLDTCPINRLKFSHG
jgi:hypothetical protein